MPSASVLPAPCLMLALLVVATATELQEPSPQRTGRRLYSFSQRNEHIWGRCSEVGRDGTGCALDPFAGPFMCSSFLSDGPWYPDMEIKLGGFRQHGQTEKMHLQWWAARKSSVEYDPLRNPESMIYSDIYFNPLFAYPQYYDADFNGGNIEVGADGEVVIRVQTMSTFMTFPFVAYPHVHLRTCMGDNFASFEVEALQFTLEGPTIVDACKSSERNVTILGYRYVGDSDWIYHASSLPSWWSTDVSPPKPKAATSSPTRLSTFLPTTSPTASPQPTTSPTAKFLPTTSPTASPQPTTSPTAKPGLLAMSQEIMDLRIKSAKEALDLDALEFSPIYNCFMEEKFFDLFSSECVEECPSSSAVVHGQCAKKEVSQTPVTLSASWLLDVDCSPECWEDTKTVILHELRVAVADHLDVPFQEASVTVSLLGRVERQLDASESRPHRRLEGHQMRLSVAVDSRRVSATADHEHLRNNFIVGVEDATYHFGLHVNNVVSDHDNAMTDVIWSVDPYTPAYDALEPGPKAGGATLGASPTDGLPPVAIICIAAGIAVVGFASAFVLWYKRWRNAKKLKDTVEGQAPNQVVGKTAEDVAEASVEQPVPTKLTAQV